LFLGGKLFVGKSAWSVDGWRSIGTRLTEQIRGAGLPMAWLNDFTRGIVAGNSGCEVQHPMTVLGRW
jgi:hypothetical protein